MNRGRENMKSCMTIVLMLILSVVSDGAETEKKIKEQKIDASFFAWIEGDTAKIGVDSKTRYRIKKLNEDHVLQQYCLDFYDNEHHVGTYCFWNENGSSMPTAFTSTIPDIKIENGWRVIITLRYFDVKWWNPEVSEEEKKTQQKKLSRWFEATYWKFNSVMPKGLDDNLYFLQSSPDMRDMETYLRQSGFEINAILFYREETIVGERKLDLSKKRAPRN